MLKLSYVQLTKIAFLIFFGAFSFISSAQENRVIDNKGTLKTIGNNRVFTTTNQPTSPTVSPDAPVEGDIWYDLEEYTVSGTTKTRGPIKVYEITKKADGSVTKQWKQISYKGKRGSVFFAGENGDITEKNFNFYFYDNETGDGVSGLHIGGGASNVNTLYRKRLTLFVNGRTSSVSYISSGNGSSSEPRYTFKNNESTGMYLSNNTSTTGALGFTVSGTSVVDIYRGFSAFSNYTTSPVDYGLNTKGRLRIGNIPEDNIGKVVMVKPNGLIVQTPMDTFGSIVTPTDVGGGMKTRTIAIHKAGGATVTTSINETITEITQATSNTDTEVTANNAKTIATYKNESGASMKINETVTELTYDDTTEKLNYKDEKGKNNKVVAVKGDPTAVFFAGADKGITYNKNQLVNVNGNLGIGVTNPSKKLVVNGEVKINTLTTGNVNTDSKVVVDANGVLKKIPQGFFLPIKSISTKNSPYNVADGDYTILIKEAGSLGWLNPNNTINLPDAANNTGRILIIKNMTSENLNSNPPYIRADSAAGATHPYFSLETTHTLQSDGVKWQHIY